MQKNGNSNICTSVSICICIWMRLAFRKEISLHHPYQTIHAYIDDWDKQKRKKMNALLFAKRNGNKSE